jgi:hypothetical protein
MIPTESLAIGPAMRWLAVALSSVFVFAVAVITAGDAIFRRLQRRALQRSLNKVGKVVAAILLTFLLPTTFTAQLAYAGQTQTPTPHPETLVARLAVESLHSFNTKLANRTATPDDLKDAISKTAMFTDYAHLTGVWKDLDSRYRDTATIEQLKNIPLTQETIVQYQYAMERSGVVITYQQAETHLLKMKTNLPQNIPDILAMGGTHVVMTTMLAHMRTMETNWRLNPTKGPQSCCGTFKTVNRFMEDPCSFMHLVAASFAVIGFFGCLPCVFAAGVAEFWGQICDNFL